MEQNQLRVLSIGTEKALFEDGPIRGRILEQLSEVESAVILIFAKNKFDATIGNIRIVSTGSLNRWFYVFDGIRLAWKLRREKINIVVTQDPVECAMVGWIASRLFKSAFAIQDHGYHFHGDYYAHESFLNRLRSIFAHWVVKRADVIRAVSKKTEDALLKLGVRQDKIMRFPVSLMGTHTKQVGLNLENKKPYFLMAARFVKIKRIDLAIRAFKIFSACHPDYQLFIVGRGPLEQEIKNLIVDSKLEDKVKIIPWADSLSDYYQNAVATLIASDREGFGMTALESLINRTPVIMTDVGCAEEIIEPGKNGLIVPVGDAVKLAEAMESMAQNQTVLKQGAQEFAWDAPQFKMIDFLQTAIQNHKKLRLLFVTQSVDKNDTILAFTAGWIQEFLNDGCEMTVFTRHLVATDLPAGARGQDLGQPIIMRVLKLWYYSFRWRKQYDAVLVHMTPQLMVLGAPVWILLGKRKYMWYMHRSITWWLKAALWLSKKTFTASDLSLRLVHPKKTIVGHGIDTDQFRPMDLPREPVILWISRIHPRKRLEDSLDFLADFKRMHPNLSWKLKVIGTAEGHEEYMELMKKKAIEFGIGENVIFAGAIKRENLPEIYARAAAFISTSQTGSLDKVVLESLACGTSVLAQGDEYYNLPGVTTLADRDAALDKLADLLAEPVTDQRARQGIVQEHDLKRLINKLVDEMSLGVQSRDQETKKGAFVLSLDLELAWGTRGDKNLTSDYLNSRRIIAQLLDLLAKYEIRATWATVGHLFLDSCNDHPEISAPAGWFDVDPRSHLQSDPIWYGKDIVERISSCPVKQEIACHTFSHVVADDPACTPEWFRSELTACKNLAAKRSLELKSFVYPKNHVAHTAILKEQGFSVYRAPDDNWYAGLPGMLKRLAHVLDNYLALPVRPVLPKKQGDLIVLPGSYFYPHARGWAKYLPASFRVSKVMRGINKAIKQKKVFHLWFHPFNLASKSDELLRGLEQIFARVAELRRQGLIDQVVMGEIGKFASEERSVLVLDGGVQSALAITRSLGSKGFQVICGAERKTAMTLHSKYCAQSFIYPSPITNPDGFIKTVKQVYDDNGGNMLILACSDATFLPISRNRDLFPGLKKILSDQDQIEMAFDKSKTLGLAQKLGVSIPDTKLPETREQAEAAGNEVGYPCILKSRHSCQWKNGWGAWGRTVIVQNTQELGEKAQEIANRTGEWPLIQKYVQGEEFGVFFLMQNGESKVEFAHRRIRSISPYGGASCMRESIEMPADMKKAGLDLLRNLNWTGVAMVEFKRDANGTPVLMEINGRFWGSLPLAIYSGADFAALLLDMADGKQIVSSGYLKNIVSRHLLADVKHLVSVLSGRDKIKGLPVPSRWIALKDFVADFLKSKSRGDVFAWNDTKPAWFEPCDVIKRSKPDDFGYNGVLHVHSAYSYDAKIDLPQLKLIFKDRGLSFACLAEHADNFPQDRVQDFIRRCRELSDPNFIFIPGFEVPCDGQHVMVMGVDDLDLNLSPLEMIETAKKDGALIVLAHPHRNKFTTGQFGALLDGVEIWNSHYDGKYVPRTKAIRFLESLRKINPGIKAYAGLDMHRMEHLGGPQIKVKAESLEQEAILRALKRGEHTLCKNKLSLDSKGQTPGTWRVWIRVASPISISLVSTFKRLSRVLRQSNVKPPEKLKAWFRKWI